MSNRHIIKPGGRAAVAISVLAGASTGILIASDPPDSKINPQSSYIEVVDSTLSGGDYDIRHGIKVSPDDPPQATWLTSNSTDDIGPRVAIASNGDVFVVWWRDTTTDQVYLRER